MTILTNPHAQLHLVGCYALTLTGALFMSPTWAAIFAWLLGAVWEFLDEMNWLHAWHISWLDPTGGDINDLICDTAGVLLAWGVLTLI